jgi:hypothetical protein
MGLDVMLVPFQRFMNSEDGAAEAREAMLAARVKMIV